jgi:hypothetical protein
MIRNASYLILYYFSNNDATKIGSYAAKTFLKHYQKNEKN